MVRLKLKLVEGGHSAAGKSAAAASVGAGKAVAQLSFPDEKCDSWKQRKGAPD